MTVARSVPTGNKAACYALNALRVYVTSIQAKALRSSVRLLGQGPHTGPYLLRTMSSNTSAFFAGASQVEHTKSDYKIDVWSRNGSKISPAARIAIGELAALISFQACFTYDKLLATKVDLAGSHTELLHFFGA